MTRVVLIRMVAAILVCLTEQIGFAAPNYHQDQINAPATIGGTMVARVNFCSDWTSLLAGGNASPDLAGMEASTQRGNLLSASGVGNAMDGFGLDISLRSSSRKTSKTQWLGLSLEDSEPASNPNVTSAGDLDPDTYGYFDAVLVSPTNLPVPEPSALSLVALAATVLLTTRQRQRTRTLV